MSDSGSTQTAALAISKTQNPNYGAMGLTAAGGIVTALSEHKAGKYNKAIADFNASQAHIQAEQALQTGGFQESVRQAEANIQQARTKSGQAAGGTVIGAGTNRLVTTSQEAGNEMDQLMIQTMANRRSYGYDVAEADDIAKGNMGMRTADNAAIATLLQTGNELSLESDPSYGGLRGSGIHIGRG